MVYIGLLVLSVILFALELTFGSVDIGLTNVTQIIIDNTSADIPKSWRIIIIESRLPRAIAAVVAGALLSQSGLFMQTLFRNPLAGPHILGVSAGSGLGVAIVLMALHGTGIFIGMKLGLDIMVMLASFIGAFLVLFLLFLISLRVKDVLTVLIFGVLIGAISMAVVGILQYLSPESQLKAFLIWTLGSFDGVELSEAKFMVTLGIPFLLLSIPLIKSLNLLLLGEEYALSMGLNVRKAQLMIMGVAGAMTAMVTAYCGPIGFIGVVVPHFSRMIFKTYDHKTLIISSALIGINIMLLSDLLSHLPGSDNILPVNSITSLIGIPFIFWMLLKRKMVQKV